MHPPPQAAGKDVMARRCPLFREGSSERGHCIRCRSGHGLGGMGKEAEEVNSSARGEVNPGEHWFN